ncbi:MAG: HEPN domain-containing protein [Eubacteriales bacterium]
MTVTEKYRYWEMISDYDMGTAEDMIKAKRWMYVASICFTAVGRLLKGLIVYNTHKEAPKSDNLVFLLGRLADNQTFSATESGKRFNAEKNDYLDLLIDITYYRINDYPFSYQKILDRFIEEDTAREVFEKTRRVIAWLKTFGPEAGAEGVQ